MARDRIELGLFGEFSVKVNGEVRSISLASTKKLLVLLSLQNGKSISRVKLGEKIWPGESEDATRPRLRTALAGLRTALKPYDPIGGDKSSLRLQPEFFESDLDHALSIYSRSHLHPSEQEEVAALESFLLLANQPFCSDFSDDWATESRAEYQKLTRDAKLRIIRLVQVFGEWSTGQKWADDLVQHAPEDEEVWFTYFLLAIQFNQSDQLLRKFRKAQEVQVAKNQATVSRSFIKQIDQLILSSQSTSSFSADQIAIVGRAMERLIEAEPAEALTFLGSVAFRDEIFLHPESAGDLCLRVLNATEGFSEERQKCITNLLVAANSMHNYDQVLHWGTELLANTTNVQRKRGTSSVLANLQFEVGHYEKAFQSLESSLLYARELGEPDGITIAQGQLGLFHARMKDFAIGDELLTEAIHKLEGAESIQSQIARGIMLRELAWSNYTQDKLELAVSNSNVALNVVRVAGTQLLIAECLSQLGVIQLAQQHVEPALESLARATVIAYRLANKHKQIAVLDTIAIALLHLGQPAEARAIIELSGRYHQENGQKVSPLHQFHRDNILSLSANIKPNAEWLIHANWQLIISGASRIFLANSA